MSSAIPSPETDRRTHSPADFDVVAVRREFPILSTTAHGRPLVYLDSAATSHKPRAVIEAVRSVYEETNANIHRGVYQLSEEATRRYEGARERVRAFINAGEAAEVIFTRGTTESLNLVAQTYGRKHVGEGDEVLVSEMEHHSNIVPWQLLCEEKGARLRVIPMNDAGELVLDDLDALLTDRTRIVAVGHMSNALGTINPVREIIEKAHARGIPVAVDGAQAVAHVPVDVRSLDADFYAFSGHKVYGPTGIGVLYAKREHLEAMPPYQGGGDMILTVSFEKTTYNEIPAKFEAGTPNISGAIGLAAALDYMHSVGMTPITLYNAMLLEYAKEKLGEIDELRVIGTARRKASVMSFVIDGVHPHDIGTVLDREGIAVRTGHHCAQPVMAHFGIPATTRASFTFYNTRDEIDTLVRGLRGVIEMFA